MLPSDWLVRLIPNTDLRTSQAKEWHILLALNCASEWRAEFLQDPKSTFPDRVVSSVPPAVEMQIAIINADYPNYL